MMNLAGKIFCRLTVQSEWVRRGKYIYWLCRCSCGSKKFVRAGHLVRWRVLSCGCWRIQSRFKHGKHGTPEYYIWNAMKQRCSNPKDKAYRNYGGRGISVCDKWLKFEGFIEDMGNRPHKALTIERVNNDLGYCPENCKWDTRTAQNLNRRYKQNPTMKGQTHDP